MGAITYYFDALTFNGICKTIAISLCPLIGQYNGIEPVCYSRNVELSGNIIFQPCKYHIHNDKKRRVLKYDNSYSYY